MTRTERHPSIHRIGTATTHGDTTTITGWGLGPCANNCGCHRHPATRALTIRPNTDAGTLGLVQHRPCTCCTPWTADQLAAIRADHDALADLDTTTLP